jgi:hypothetical protein
MPPDRILVPNTNLCKAPFGQRPPRRLSSILGPSISTSRFGFCTAGPTRKTAAHGSDSDSNVLRVGLAGLDPVRSLTRQFRQRLHPDGVSLPRCNHPTGWLQIAAYAPHREPSQSEKAQATPGERRHGRGSRRAHGPQVSPSGLLTDQLTRRRSACAADRTGHTRVPQQNHGWSGISGRPHCPGEHDPCPGARTSSIRLSSDFAQGSSRVERY